MDAVVALTHPGLRTLCFLPRSFTRQLLVAVLLLLIMKPEPGRAEAVQFPSPEQITPENADRVVQLDIMGHGTITDLQWSPDGNILALASAPSGIVWLYNPMALEDAPRELVGNATGTTGLAFSPDGARLASAGIDQLVHVWDVMTGAETQVFSTAGYGTNRVVFSPDGRRLAAGAQRIWIWDAATGDRITILPTTQFINTFVFSPDSARLIGGGVDGTLWVWDANTGALLATLGGYGDSVHSVAYSPDGAMFAAGDDDGMVRLWDWSGALGGHQVVLRGHEESVEKVSFSPDGKILASASQDNTIRLWDTHTGAVHTMLTGHTARVKGIAFSPDSSILASIGDDDTLRTWDVQSGVLATSVSIPRGQALGVAIARLSRDGQTIVAGGYDGTITLWDMTTRRQMKTLNSLAGIVWGVAFSPDGTMVASAGESGLGMLWDVATGEIRAQFVGSWSVDFSPDGRFFANSSPSTGGTVLIRDVQTGEQQLVLSGHRNTVLATVYSPDGTMVATSGGDFTARIWDARTGELLRVLETHSGPVCTLAFSPDSTMLASGGYGGSIRLWDVATGERRAVMNGHEHNVLGVAFSPDGRLLVSSGGNVMSDAPSLDNTIRLWDVATATQVGILYGHTSSTNSVGFSPDGRMIVSASEDGTIRLWGVPAEA